MVDPGLVIQTIDASLWSPPSTDSAGITYRPDTGEFLMCDSEVNETVDGITHYQGVNVWTHTNTGSVVGTATTVPWSNEPTGISFDPAGGRLWISDDIRDSIYQVELGPDGVFGTSDDTQLRLRGYVEAGCSDLEDVAYDNLNGRLFVGSGGASQICLIEPGPDGVFSGAATFGDDVVTYFSVADHGIEDPEGIVYDPFWNTLVVADRGTRDLYELTPEGGYLRKIDVNFPGGSKISGVTIGPGSTNPSLRNYFVTDRGVDNNADPFAVDGRIYEVVAIPLGGNGPPIVDAGPPQTLEWPASSTELDGFVNDDGHPYPPSTVLALWSQLEGPGSVSFEDASSPVTTATFSAPGEYLLQLLGDDSAAQTTDTVAVTVNHTVTLGVTTLGPGSVTLDPPGGSYPAGTSVTVTATPDADSAFMGWSGDLSGTTNPQPLLMDGDKSVTATFSPLYDVSVNVTGPGTLTLDPPTGPYAPGSVVTVTATPDANAVFDGFTGDLAGTESPQLLSVDADKTIGASFTATAYTLNVTLAGGGTVTLDPPAGPYPHGSIVTLTAVPTNGNWLFESWSGDAAGSANPLLLTMDGNKSVHAKFVGTGGAGTACGIGPELAAALPLLAWLRRRRQRAR